ncbi:hypothetical protein [Crocosphaera sp.]|uniref:hypothetical protein n=1 Tax=Crocosphaera sp. TaxID=2729996 RepID=UPI003F26E6DD|nr:hypothetical protein [Crocosphaera sp.]
MSQENKGGCSGCLGTLILCGFLFGGLRCSVNLGGLSFGFGSGIQHNNNVTDLTELNSYLDIAKKSVDDFNSKFNQGQCEIINEGISKDLKEHLKQSDHSDFSNVCEQFIKQFGSIESSKLIDENVVVGENFSREQSYYVTLIYDKKFTKLSEPVQTLFTWQVHQQQKPELYQYVINYNNSDLPSPVHQL